MQPNTVVGLKRMVSSYIKKCVVCRKLRDRFNQQKMSDLLEDRFKPSPLFSYVGIDTFGPRSVAFIALEKGVLVRNVGVYSSLA
jgi:hypothetical protein